MSNDILHEVDKRSALTVLWNRMSNQLPFTRNKLFLNFAPDSDAEKAQLRRGSSELTNGSSSTSSSDEGYKRVASVKKNCLPELDFASFVQEVSMINMGQAERKHVICMASDFFLPSIGGIETHILNLSQYLIQRGHRIIVMTHKYKEKYNGIHFINGLKVYYLPLHEVRDHATLPGIFPNMKMMRTILLKEKVTLVHGHAAFSGIAHECMFYAKLLGIHTVFTDHSLMGLRDLPSIISNKVLEICLINSDHNICVSHIGKVNLCLRAKLDPDKVSVIPHTINTRFFRPNARVKNLDEIVVIVVSRMVFRKGIDLLAPALGILCQKYPKVRVEIVGDGPRKYLLTDMVRIYHLESRVTMHGLVGGRKVRDIMATGDIFLNTSLTEAFCMTLVEAAACGLIVVSTNVGGIPEVLPPDMIYLAETKVDSILDSLDKAIWDFTRNPNTMSPAERNRLVGRMYDPLKITKNVENVYEEATKVPNMTWWETCRRYTMSSDFLVFVVVFLSHIWMWALNFFFPADSITECKYCMKFISRKTAKKHHVHCRRKMGRKRAFFKKTF